MHPSTEAAWQTSVISEHRQQLQRVTDIVHSAVLQLNAQLAKEQRIGSSIDANLFGNGGVLDSLGLANFIVLLEQKLERSFGQPFDLTEGDPFSPENSRFRTIRTLAIYISERLSRGN